MSHSRSWQLVRLWHHVDGRRRVQLGLLLVLMVFASLAEVISIGAIVPFLAVLTTPERIFHSGFVKPLVQVLGINEPGELILPLTVIFILAAIWSGAMRLIMLYVQMRLSYVIGADLGLGIYRRSLYQPYLVHTTRNSSDIIAAITHKTLSVAHYTILPILNIVSSLLILVSIVAALMVIDPQIAMASMAGFGLIYGIVIVLTRKRLMRDGQRVAEEQSRVVRVVQEGLGGIRDVLIDGTQEVYSKIYRDADVPLRLSQANIQIIAGSPRYGVEALGMVLVALIAYWLVGRPGGLMSSVSTLGALALGAQRMLPVLQLCFAGWSSLRGGQAALVDVLDLLEQPLPDHAERKDERKMPFERAIVLKAVSFRYGDDLPWVLRSIDLTIPRGSRIGFIGETGSGKSTALDLVMGLLPPTEGALEIDGQAVTPANCRGWQAHLAHVPQAIFLADGTIAENIAFGIPADRIDRDRVKRAARAAQIAEAIEGWAEQYDTIVGERGVRLSGGQRQRIGIARALYKAADTIVLDEATSALDTATEEAVMRTIEGLGSDMTVLIVAHRLSTLRTCDRVVELRDGRIARVGTYADMMGTSLPANDLLMQG